MTRLVQIHSFYEPYLGAVYAAQPGLRHAPSDRQTETLIADGFCAGHLFAPHLGAPLIVANNAIAQQKWAQEHGLGLDDPWQIAIAQVEAYRPDVLYLSHPLELDSRFVRALSYRPELVVGWRAAPTPDDVDWSAFDLLLSHLSTCRDFAIRRGAREALHFFPGFPTGVLPRLAGVTPEHDVVFSGQWTTHHTFRNGILAALAQASDELGCSVGFYLSWHEGDPPPPEVRAFDRGAVWGIDMYRCLRKGRIVVNAEIDMARGEAGNMRLFEVTGAGSFLLTEHHPNVEEFFVPGREIETFQDAEEAREKIRYYLAHPTERERIARAGHEKCIRSFGVERRARAFADLVERRTGRGRVSTLLGAGVADLQAGRTEGALEHLSAAKQLRVPVRDLDYVRALAFLEQGKLGDARECLKEELRHFADHAEAAALLQEVLAREERHRQARLDAIEDDEFERLFEQVRPFTMLPIPRLYALFGLAKEVCVLDLPGNFVECGVAGGGSSAMLAAVVKRYSQRDRTVFACDTFEGMPAPTPHDTVAGVAANATGWGAGTCSAPTQSVREISARLGVADTVVPVQGYFEDTLPAHGEAFGPIALLHADCDWYSSAKTVFDELYDRVVEGGVIQIDDYGYWEGVATAVEEFQAERGIRFELEDIGGAAWLMKACYVQ